MLAEASSPSARRRSRRTSGMLIDRVADRSQHALHWDNAREDDYSTFARQALPMTWDFSEVNPFGGSSGDLAMHLEASCKVDRALRCSRSAGSRHARLGDRSAV